MSNKVHSEYAWITGFTVAMIITKLYHIITWSWFWILAPFCTVLLFNLVLSLFLKLLYKKFVAGLNS